MRAPPVTTEEPPRFVFRDDPLLAAIVGLIVAITLWLALFPFVPAVTRATMDRFHLRTESFALWAIQQPIPAMYSFRNRYAVIRHQDGKRQISEQATINHFPLRSVTFANGRYRNLKDRQDCQIELESSYRGHRLRTVYQVDTDADITMRLRRVDDDHGQLPTRGL
ncbi:MULTISPECIES: hypothetical protein [Crateriforma]|uniref:Uncharacterized protein n=1 Tax=Crateriforma conspicua TaxID=2527996 RepID=A0A5C6FS93_9PLAN|nr:MULTISPECIES: hypothetical protein [Crateriforma]TWU65201.1 hypothetical protein V7x_07470 [Crateriforma conspicua]